MAEDPKTPPAASAADLAALAGRVKTLESQLAELKAGEAERKKSIDALTRRLAGDDDGPVYPWRHRESGKRARIIDQGNETVFELEGGKPGQLPTHEFNSLYEDATAN